MKHKAYFKSTRRLFAKHILRLFSISAIFIVTVSLISGLGDVEGNIKKSIATSYEQDNIHDLVIRGFSDNLDWLKGKLKEIDDIKTVEEFYTYDTPDKNDDHFASRAIFRNLIDKPDNAIDKLELIEGEWPKKADEILIERKTNDFISSEIGEIRDIIIQPSESPVPETFSNMKVVGIVKNPTMVALKNEPSDYYKDNDEHYVNDVFYLDIGALDDSPYKISKALSINLKNRKIFNSFSEEYKEKIEKVKAEIEILVKESEHSFEYSLISLNENYSLASLDMYAEKVGMIAVIFIVFFILIAILVIYSTMSRLLDEDRGSMAVLKTLGYSDFAIAIRYITYVFIAGLVGAAISAAPAKAVNSMILNAFNIQYAIKQIRLPIVGQYFFIFSGIIILVSTILTLIKSIRTADHRPIELLTPKAPKAGKRVFLERFKRAWNKLSFRYKSTFRNVFLFKGRLLMTILSIMSATVLVFASFSLLNNANVMEGFESLKIISIVLLGFSAGLCALVIYNITNINISERTREIATLMVLGYRNNEVTGYVYREIYILTVIGAILGLPAGVGFIKFVFDYIGVFEIGNIEWWTYVVSPIITFIFAVLATRLLHYKIVRTDMNESLKVLE